MVYTKLVRTGDNKPTIAPVFLQAPPNGVTRNKSNSLKLSGAWVYTKTECLHLYEHTLYACCLWHRLPHCTAVRAVRGCLFKQSESLKAAEGDDNLRNRNLQKPIEHPERPDCALSNVTRHSVARHSAQTQNNTRSMSAHSLRMPYYAEYCRYSVHTPSVHTPPLSSRSVASRRGRPREDQGQGVAQKNMIME